MLDFNEHPGHRCDYFSSDALFQQCCFFHVPLLYEVFIGVVLSFLFR